MSAIDNGGPAFPQPGVAFDPMREQVCKASVFGCDMGITMRDYFAAKAMQAQVMTDMVPGDSCDALVDAAAAAGQDAVYRLALNAYEIADAMLKAMVA